MRGEPVWEFGWVKFYVAVHARGESLVQRAGWRVDLGVRLQCAIIRRPAGEVLGDAVVPNHRAVSPRARKTLNATRGP